MQITLIRHLPTDWNKKSWLQGRRDIGITSVSNDDYKEINNNKKLLSQLAPFDIVLSSTLKRTSQTAQFYGYITEIECLLDELDFGPFEGQTKEHLLEEFRDIWIENPKEIVLGESILNLKKRIILFLSKYKRYTNILVFGHGSWIRAMLSYNRFGHINDMNKMNIENNQCITIQTD